MSTTDVSVLFLSPSVPHSFLRHSPYFMVYSITIIIIYIALIKWLIIFNVLSYL